MIYISWVASTLQFLFPPQAYLQSTSPPPPYHLPLQSKIFFLKVNPRDFPIKITFMSQSLSSPYDLKRLDS